MPQLVASSHPITFMNLRGSWFVIQLCLCFEVIGITHFSWVLTSFVRFIFGMKDGDVFCLDDPDGVNPILRLKHINSFLAHDNMYVDEITTAELLHSSSAYGLRYVK